MTEPKEAILRRLAIDPAIDMRAEILCHWDEMEKTLKHLRVEFITSYLGMIDLYREDTHALKNAKIKWQRDSFEAVELAIDGMLQAVQAFIKRDEKEKNVIIVD